MIDQRICLSYNMNFPVKTVVIFWLSREEQLVNESTVLRTEVHLKIALDPTIEVIGSCFIHLAFRNSLKAQRRTRYHIIHVIK